MRKIDGIEASRGIAACLVVFYHAANHIKYNFGYLPMGGWAQFGHAGVDFFFVLSGFIIYFVHQCDVGVRGRLAGYFERRFTRIYPIYWVAMGAALLITVLSSKRVLPSLEAIAWDGMLLPQVEGMAVGVSWTLRHEVLFYVLFSVCILSQRIGMGVMGLWLCGILAYMVLDADLGGSPFLKILLSPFNLQFFLGMAAAYFAINGKLSRPNWWLRLGLLAFLLIGAAEDLAWFDGYGVAARWLYGLSAMAMVMGLAGGDHLFSKSTALLALGKASYSIYLFHLIGIGVVYKSVEWSGWLKTFPVWLLYLVLCVAGVTIGVVASRWVEYPLMKHVRVSLTHSLRPA